MFFTTNNIIKPEPNICPEIPILNNPALKAKINDNAAIPKIATFVK